jgi:quinol monooxygenase YgiN
MLIVIGKAGSVPEKRAEVIELMRWMQSESRKEPGCIDYGFYESIETENEFVAVELWESKEALQAHFSAHTVARFSAEIGGLVSRPPEVEVHVVERTTGFPDLD